MITVLSCVRTRNGYSRKEVIGLTNTNKLKGRIIECGYNLGNFSAKMGMSRLCFRKRLCNQRDFTTGEILRMCDLLDIAFEQTRDYFFVANVPKTGTQKEANNEH